MLRVVVLKAELRPASVDTAPLYTDNPLPIFMLAKQTFRHARFTNA